MRWRRVFIFAACFTAFGVHAARTEELQQLTLGEAHNIALRNHPRISEAELEALASREVATQVHAGFLPNVTFNATAVGTGGSDTRIAAGGLNNPVIYEREADGLTVTQLLTDFGRTEHLLNSSRLHSRAANANAEATREEIILQVDIAFFTALKAQSVLEVAHQTRDTRKLLLDQVTALATNKLRSDLDLSFSKVAYEEGELLVAKAQNDMEVAFNSLSTLLGDREKRTYRLIEEPMLAVTPMEPAALVDTALSRRPDLARLRLERDAAQQYARAQRALSYPTINAFGSGGYSPVRDTTHLEDHYLAGGVNLSLPILDGGLNSAKRSEAELRSQAASEALLDAENNAIHDVRSASLNVAYAAQRLDLTQKLFDNASQSYDLAEARYKLGSSSIVELSQVQLSKTEAEIAHTSARYEYEIQHAVLDYETGVTQ